MWLKSRENVTKGVFDRKVKVIHMSPRWKTVMELTWLGEGWLWEQLVLFSTFAFSALYYKVSHFLLTLWEWCFNILKRLQKLITPLYIIPVHSPHNNSLFGPLHYSSFTSYHIQTMIFSPLSKFTFFFFAPLCKIKKKTSPSKCWSA